MKLYSSTFPIVLTTKVDFVLPDWRGLQDHFRALQSRGSLGESSSPHPVLPRPSVEFAPRGIVAPFSNWAVY